MLRQKNVPRKVIALIGFLLLSFTASYAQSSSATAPGPAREVYRDAKPGFLTAVSRDGKQGLFTRYPSHSENHLLRVDLASGKTTELYPGRYRITTEGPAARLTLRIAPQAIVGRARALLTAERTLEVDPRCDRRSILEDTGCWSRHEIAPSARRLLHGRHRRIPADRRRDRFRPGGGRAERAATTD